jgi:DNA-binding LacI/PurR family transcriptional regulator
VKLFHIQAGDAILFLQIVKRADSKAPENSRKTLKDVATAAGVSTATVSRVLNRSAPVSREVEASVREAAERLGVPLMRQPGNRMIAFLLNNRSLLHQFHSQVLVASEAYCADRSFDLLFLPMHYPSDVPWKQLQVPRILKHRDNVDGLIVSGVNSENLLELLTHVGLPFTVFGDTVQGEWAAEKYDVVWIDDITGSYDMTVYLQSLGHTRIWYLANNRHTWFARRFQGYSRAMEDAGLPHLVRSVDSENERDVGFLGTKYILQTEQKPQAIFCGSDAICHGVYAALRDAGLNVPDDVSVAGFNDTPEATALQPNVTSVSVFPDHVGRSLGELLIARIDNPSLPAQSRMIPTQVVRRESCRPAPPPSADERHTRGGNGDRIVGSRFGVPQFGR